MDNLNGILEWYQDKLGINIPEIKMIDLPAECIPIGMENCLLLVGPVRKWEEIDNVSFRASKQDALELLCHDKDFSEISRDSLSSQFEKLVGEEIEGYSKKAKTSRDLIKYVGQKNGERIYVFPRYRKLIQEGITTDEKLLLDSFLAHELLHNEQEKRGLNAKYPIIREGPAWVLQFLYGIDKVGFEEYKKRFQEFSLKLNPSQDHSNREKGYLKNVDLGVEVVTSNLDINFRGEVEEQLEKFKTIFEMPRYRQLEAELIYRFFKPKLAESSR